MTTKMLSVEKKEPNQPPRLDNPRDITTPATGRRASARCQVERSVSGGRQLEEGRSWGSDSLDMSEWRIVMRSTPRTSTPTQKLLLSPELSLLDDPLGGEAGLRRGDTAAHQKCKAWGCTRKFSIPLPGALGSLLGPACKHVTTVCCGWSVCF